MRRLIPSLAAAMVFAGAAITACQGPPAPPVVYEAPVLRPAGPPTTPAAVPADSGSATKAAPAEVSERLLDEPGRRVLKLSNGFTVLLQQNKTAPIVATRIYIKAGALTEGQHMAAGISHVLEHLVAGATSGKRQEAENTLLLLQIGNDSNAYTDADQTCYFITTASDKWPVALDLLVDFTTNANFTREQFEREFKVVQREIEMDEAETDHVFYNHTLANRYLESPARHPVVGYKPAFQALTYEDAKAYYQKMYVPDNMIISIAGDLDLDAAEQRVLSEVKDIRRRAVPAVALPPEPAVTTPRRSVSRGDVKEARIDWAFPTSDIYSADLYATDVLASILGGGDSSILVRKLRDELALVADISCENPTPRYVQGQIEIAATLAPDKIMAAQEALFAALDGVVKEGVTEEALQRAKAQAAARLVFDNQTAEQIASRNGEDFLIAGNIDFTPRYTGHIQEVTREQVLAAARKYLSRDHLLTTVLLPRNADDPFAPKVSAAPAAAGAVGVKKVVLKNGVTLLISRNPAAPLACFNLYTMGGLLAEDESNNGIGTLMMNLMARETTTRSHEQIADFLDSTGGSLSATSASNVFQLSMACLKDKAAESFGVFADVALHPKFSGDELKQIRHSLISTAETATEDWSGEAFKMVRDIFYATSPYKRVPEGNTAVIEKLTPDQIAEHYKNYFLDPAHMVIAISGDIDPEAAVAWAQPFEAIAPHNPTLNLFSIAAEARTVVRPTVKQSATVMLAYPGANISSADRHALVVLKTYFSGYSSPGGSMLFDTLRGKGLVYTVDATNTCWPAGGLFLITALGEPQNTGAIVANIQQVIDGVKRGEVPDTLFAAAKDQAITGEKLSKPTVAERSAQEALAEVLGLGWDDEVRFGEKINAVTKEQMVRIANKYLTTPTIVILTPEAKAN